MTNKARIARALIASALAIGGFTALKVSPSGAAPEAQMSRVCRDWSAPGQDYRYESAQPGFYVFVFLYVYKEDTTVAFAGDTLTLSVQAPQGSIGHLEIKDSDVVVASSNRIPGTLSFRIPRDALYQSNEMSVTLDVPRAGRLVVDPGCVGPCRLPGQPTLQSTLRGAGSLLRCQGASLLPSRPDVRSVRFTPKTATPAAAPPEVADAPAPKQVNAPVVSVSVPTVKVPPVVVEMMPSSGLAQDSTDTVATN